MEDLSRGRSSRTAPRNGCVLQELVAPIHGHWPLLTQALRWFENVHGQYPMKTKTTAQRQTLIRKENRVGRPLALPYRLRLAITIGGKKTNILHTEPEDITSSLTTLAQDIDLLLEAIVLSGDRAQIRLGHGAVLCPALHAFAPPHKLTVRAIAKTGQVERSGQSSTSRDHIAVSI